MKYIGFLIPNRSIIYFPDLPWKMSSKLAQKMPKYENAPSIWQDNGIMGLERVLRQITDSDVNSVQNHGTV